MLIRSHIQLQVLGPVDTGTAKNQSINQKVKIIVPHNSNAIAGALNKAVTKPKTNMRQKEVHAGYD